MFLMYVEQATYVYTLNGFRILKIFHSKSPFSISFISYKPTSETFPSLNIRY